MLSVTSQVFLNFAMQQMDGADRGDPNLMIDNEKATLDSGGEFDRPYFQNILQHSINSGKGTNKSNYGLKLKPSDSNSLHRAKEDERRTEWVGHGTRFTQACTRGPFDYLHN